MKIDVLGVKIDALSKDQVIDVIKSNLSAVKCIFIVTPYSESIVAAQKDEEFKNILNSADIALPDGTGILWAAHYLSLFPSPGLGRDQGRGRTIVKLITSLLSILFRPLSSRDPIPEKISGSEFIWDLAELAAKNDYSVFLLGGYDDTPGLVAAKLQSRFPNLKIAGISSPSPDDGEGGGEVEKINNSHADFLFVALGPIRQEKWLYHNLKNLNVKLAIGLGGTFDYLAGKHPLAPQIWRSIGLEWLWRLLTQPWRIWRISKGVLGLIWYTLRY